jgi:hypothetical protein
MQKGTMKQGWKVIIGILIMAIAGCGGGGGDTGGGASPVVVDPPTGNITPPGTAQKNPPPAPTNVVALPSTGQVKISWNNVTGATSYTLYMASSSGVTKTTYTTLPDGTKRSAITNPHTQTGLTNGRTYFFVITAVNADGESSESTEVSALPNTQGANWSSPHTLGQGSEPDVGGDGNGNAMAVWLAYDGLLYHIYAQKFSVTNGWTATETIADLAINEVPAGLKVAMYGQGNALVAWHQNGGQTFGVFAKRFLASSGWEQATRIGFGGSAPVTSGYRGSPQIAVNTSGKAVAVWEQPGGGFLDSIIASYYTPGTGWTPVTTIENGAGHAEEPVVSIDPAGNALSIWKQTDGTAFSIWSNSFTIGSGWGTATLVEAGISPTFSPALAMDASGNALAIWLQPSNILVNRFEPGTGWKGTTLLWNSGFASPPDIAMNADGHAVVVWGEASHILSSRYTASSGWTAPTRVDIGLDPLSALPHPKVAIDSAGTAVSIWQNKTSRFTGSYSTLTGGWQTPVMFGPAGCCSSSEVLFGVSFANNGNALAVWPGGNTASSFANHFLLAGNP